MKTFTVKFESPNSFPFNIQVEAKNALEAGIKVSQILDLLMTNPTQIKIRGLQ